ncbi:hypothetical protein IJH29_02560 [Candidatus Saccharibacteria bacterium]|nr:hypothetical protein [Candidatus Saccharibacteria bacterium]
MNNSTQETSEPHLSHGGKNLLLLWLGAAIFTFLTTFVALKVYHDSGDIYLDRSRPGFLPEKSETKDSDEASFTFSDTGKITSENLGELLTNLKAELNSLNDYPVQDPFGASALSNETLGL